MQAETIKKNMFDWKQQWYAVHKTAHEQHELHSSSDSLPLQWMTMLTAPQRPKQLSIYIDSYSLLISCWQSKRQAKTKWHQHSKSFPNRMSCRESKE